MSKRKSITSRAINAALSAIIRTIFGWVEEWGDDAFFFLVIGDRNCTDVAWYNTDNLSCDGALAVTGCLESVAAFQDLATSVDILNEDNLKNEEFRKKFEQTSPSEDDHGWYSYDDICGGKKYTEKQAKKGGEQ